MAQVSRDIELVGPVGVPTLPARRVYVYAWTIRLFHWVLVAAVVVLAVTGWFVGRPLPSVSGEASDHFVMGWFRVVHFVAAYALAIAWLARFVLALLDGPGARDLFRLRFWTAEYWKELGHELKFYTFLTREFRPTVGHNALAKTSYVFGFMGVSLLMMASGFAMYGEALGSGSWADTLFGWVIPLVGQSQTVHMLHRLGMWIIGLVAAVHVYMVLREELATTQSSLSTMISGFRFYRGKGER